jgi:hypothetical protein
MSQVASFELPSHARLWIFPADRPLRGEERQGVAGRAFPLRA